mgnify:CR=1 FL=1
MQELCVIKLDWDDKIPSEFVEKWTEFKNDIQNVAQISIPRWLATTPQNLDVHLHGFSDASENALVSVLYLKIVNSQNETKISLIEAKTKVSPLKRVSIPR